MALLQIEFFGKHLGKMASMAAICPQEPGPYPVLYLLHGHSDNHSAWFRRSGIERYVEGQNLIVVMPDGFVSFYCNDPRPGGLPYEDHIVKDVVQTIDRMLPTIPRREGRGIAGLSMGGYGAMKLAMKHPDMFAAASSHSGALDIASLGRERHVGSHASEVAKTVADDSSDNCFHLAKQLVGREPRPAIRFDCGVDDFLIEDNRHYHAHLEAVGLEHTYAEYPGEHTWDYWDEHVRETVQFMVEHLGKS
jgi:S-formylglutathione hydrolase FrmB